MDKSLEKIIEARKKQAADRKLVEKLDTIVRNLGKKEARCTIVRGFLANTDEIWEDTLVFNYKELRIVNCGDTATEVYVVKGNKERLVFNGCKDEEWYYQYTHPTMLISDISDVIEAYIPGEWEKYLPNLYREEIAEGRKKEKEESREIKREFRDDFRTRWGI